MLKTVQEIIKQYGEQPVREVLPDFDINCANSINHRDFNLILNNVKRYVKCNRFLVEKLTPYREQIKTLFNIDNAIDLTIQQLEQLVMKNPELNMDYVYKHFVQLYRDSPTVWNNIYEHGYQYAPFCQDGKMYYLKFYDFLTIDHDTVDDIHTVLDYIEENKSFLFDVYQTYNGYHFMLVSHAIPHYDKNIVPLMSRLKCDVWYILYSHKYGYRLRLTPKIGRNETFVAKFIKTVGYGARHPKCSEMTQIYRHYLNCRVETPRYTGDFYDSFIYRVMYLNKQLDEVSQLDLDQCRCDKNQSLVKYIRKPQLLIINKPDYYVAMDQATRTYYICFKSLMMIDIDVNKLKKPEQQQQEQFDLDKYLESNFDINQSAVIVYKSLHGYHLFLVDKTRPHDDIENCRFMESKQCDYYYCLFSYYRGYSVRLNRKTYREDNEYNGNIYHFIKFYGQKSLINRELHDFVDLHYDLMLEYQNKVNCLMR